jgi:hypothetical protein
MVTPKYRRVKTPSTHTQSTIATNLEVFSLTTRPVTSALPEATGNAVFWTFLGKGGGEEQRAWLISKNERAISPPPLHKSNSPSNTRACITNQTGSHRHTPEATGNAVFWTFLGKGGRKEQRTPLISNNGRAISPLPMHKSISHSNIRAYITHHQAPIRET